MDEKLISLEATPFFLMHLLGAPTAAGMLFLVRRGCEFSLLPYFPGQGTRRPEEDLHSGVEALDTLLAFVAHDWEIVGRLQIDFTAARGEGLFWAETLERLAAIDATWRTASPCSERALRQA